MDRWGSGSGAGSAGAKLSEQEMMEKVETALQQETLQSFMNTVQEKCFKLCITKPGTSISSSEQQCLTRCCDRYQDALNVVGQAMLGPQSYKRWLHVHYLSEVCAVGSYALFRTAFLRHDDFSQSRVEDEQALWQWEHRVLQIMATTIFLRILKVHTWEEGVSAAFSVLKLAGIMLTFTMDWRICIAYLTLLGLLYLLFPSPGYTGPDNVYELTPKTLKEMIVEPAETAKQKVAWLVHIHKRSTALYAHEQPLFAELSLEYAHPQLQFARVDVEQWPLIQKVLGIVADQQPVVVLMEGNRVLQRYPAEISTSWLPPPKLKKAEWIEAFNLQQHASKAAAAGESAGASSDRPVLANRNENKRR